MLLDPDFELPRFSLAGNRESQLKGSMQGQISVVADDTGGRAAGARAITLAIRTVTNYELNTMPWFFNLKQGYEGDLKYQISLAQKRSCQAREYLRF